MSSRSNQLNQGSRLSRPGMNTKKTMVKEGKKKLLKNQQIADEYQKIEFSGYSHYEPGLISFAPLLQTGKIFKLHYIKRTDFRMPDGDSPMLGEKKRCVMSSSPSSADGGFPRCLFSLFQLLPVFRFT